jgi:hypothetical protein
MMEIIACDPGRKSGVTIGSPGNFEGMEIDYPDIYFKLEELVMTDKYSVLVCENFFITSQTAKKSVGLAWSLRIIGVCDYLCTRQGLEFVLQSPSEAKNFVDNKKLKEYNCWFPGEGHAKDSARHAILYYFKNHPKEILP